MADETTALARSQPHYLDEDFDTIHEAVLETARGRWFLHEYARRNRSADTEMLLAALSRIETAMGVGAGSQPPAPLPDLQLLELRDAIALTRDNLGAIGAKDRAITAADFNTVSAALGSVTARLRATFERLQETAWTLRDRDGANPLCDSLDTQARDIARLCAQLDEIGGGAGAMVALLSEIEDRVGAMIAQAVSRPAAAPPRMHPQDEERSAPATDMPASQAQAPEHVPQPEADQDEVGGAVVLVFDPDYERMMGEAVDAALVSEYEGAEWHLPAEMDEVAEPQALAPETPHTEAAASVSDTTQAAREPDLSDRSFEALSAEAAPHASSPDAATMAWIETLAPKVRAAGQAAPRSFEDIDFPLAAGKVDAVSAAEPPRSLPNIASRERRDEPDSVPVTGQIAAAVQREIEAAMDDIRDAVQARLAEEVQPHLTLLADEPDHAEPRPEMSSAAPQPAPAAPPARPADPLAPIMALSDEEKIALFS